MNIILKQLYLALTLCVFCVGLMQGSDKPASEDSSPENSLIRVPSFESLHSGSDDDNAPLVRSWPPRRLADHLEDNRNQINGLTFTSLFFLGSEVMTHGPSTKIYVAVTPGTSDETDSFVHPELALRRKLSCMQRLLSLFCCYKK